MSPAVIMLKLKTTSDTESDEAEREVKHECSDYLSCHYGFTHHYITEVKSIMGHSFYLYTHDLLNGLHHRLSRLC